MCHLGESTIWSRDCEVADLPAFEELPPILVYRQVGAVEVCGRGARLGWTAKQAHTGFFQLASPFLGVAGGASADEIGPAVVAASMARNHMVDRQMRCLRPAVLAGVSIAPKQLSLCQSHARPRPLDHVVQADYGRSRIELTHCADVAATVKEHLGLAAEHHANGSARGAYIERFEVGVQHQYRRVHGSPPICGRLYHPNLAPQATGKHKKNSPGSSCVGQGRCISQISDVAFSDFGAHEIKDRNRDGDEPYRDPRRAVIQELDPLNEQEPNTAAANQTNDG